MRKSRTNKSYNWKIKAMKLLRFNVKLKTSKHVSEIINVLNKYLDSNFELNPSDSSKFWTEWKSNCFGLELTITHFSDKNQYYISGNRSEKIAHIIPLKIEFEYTDISSEMLDLFLIIMPEESWFL